MIVWFSLLNCQPSTMAVNDLMTSETTRKFLQGSGIHFCGAMYPYNSSWYPCSLGKSSDASYDFFITDGPYCGKFKHDFNSYKITNLKESCYEGTPIGEYYSVMFVQCVDVGSVIVNSIQLTTYSIMITVYLYIVARIVNKFGFCGLFSSENWKKVTSNKNWAKDNSATDIELSVV